MTRFTRALAQSTALTSVAVAVTFASPARAQDALAGDGLDLGTITVSANQQETETARSGSTVEVVEEEEIRAAGEVPVAEFLDSLPGISVSSNGPVGTQTTLRIRGAAGYYVGVYVDGIEVTDPSNTQISFDWANLMTSDLCRIEVLKGAQSALYGSEAVAGVINITTNRASEPGVANRFAVELGSYNSAKLSFNSSWLGENGSFAATLSRVSTDGFSAADENDGNTEDDGLVATRLSFAGEYDVTDVLTLGGAGFWQYSDGEFDASGGGPGGDAANYSLSEEYGARAFARLEQGAVEHEVSAQYYAIDRTSHDGLYGDTLYTGDRSSVAYLGGTSLGPAVDLSFGADATWETFNSTYNDGAYELYGVFAETSWAPSDQLDVVASLRHDEHSDYGGHTTGRLSVAYRPTEDLILRFATGTGFRAPSLYELYSPYGDPDFQPEESVTYELGAEKRFGADAFVKATLFRTEITDQIVYNFSSWSYEQQSGTSEMQGVELSTGMALTPSLRLRGNYTYTEAEDATDRRLARVPQHDLNLSLAADLTADLTATLSVQHVADTVDGIGSPPVEVDLPDYTLVNLGMGYALNDATTAYFRVENLFDEQYQRAHGYGTSDRAFYFGVRGSF